MSLVAIYKNYNYKKKLVLCTIFASVSFSMTACNFKQSTEEKQAENVKEKIEIDIELAKLSKPFTQEDNPQIYQQWGKDWVDIINTMLPLSAESVYKQPECDMVEKLELSEKSVMQEMPIVDVFCENEEIFSVTLSDVTQNKRLFPQSKLFGKSTDELINACLQPIKPNLMHPDSITTDGVNINLTMDSNQQSLTMQIPITVKTGYDSHITHMVSCQVDSQLNATAKLNPMPKKNK